MSLPHLAPWTAAGDLVFVSGQLPFDAARTINETTTDGQTAQVLRNLETVLNAAGLGLADVVKTTVWLRPEADFAAFNAAYAAAFGDHKPARSTVFSDLVAPKALVEIEAVAHRRAA